MGLVKLQVGCLIILLFIATIYFRTKRLKTKTGDCFSMLLLAMILNITMDTITVLTINHRDIVPSVLNRVLCAIFQESLILVLMLNSNYVFYMIQEELKSYKSLKVINYVPFIIVTIVNILIPVKYMDTPNGTYTYGGPSNVCYTSVVIYVIISGVRLFKHYKEIAPRKRNITLASLVIFLVVAGYGATNPTLLIHGFGLTLIVFATFLTVESPDARLIELLQIEKEKADEASKAKGHFLANMSHEIRTPINAVLGLDTMILRESKEANIRKYASDIQSSGRSLLALVNDILDFSKIESGKMQLVYNEYDFSSVINDVVNMIRPKAQAKGLDFVINVDEHMPSSFIGDDVRIKQIIVNLLTNAVKYTNEGKVELAIHSAQEDNTAYISVHVKDTGIGIKPEDIHKLSEEFVRIEESRNKNIEGTGLGTSIVMNLLKLMNSKLEVTSTYGEGSEFYFTVSQTICNHEPIGNIEERFQNLKQEEEYQAAFCIPDSRLLVVDDNAMNRNVFINLLKGMHCPIDEAESGTACLELVKENKYDIIFMDHMMPEMDGIETFHHMQEFGEYINAETPVVILTANAISGAKEEYMSEGFTAYLSKPIDVGKLEAMIGKLIPDDKKKPAEKKTQAVEPSPDIELPFIDGVDWKHAILKLKTESLLMDSVKNFSNMAQMDIKMLMGMYEKLNTSESRENFDEYRIKVHSMKSNVATIGADHVAGLAKYLEYAAKDYNIDTIHQLMPLFEKEWNSLKAEIDEAFGFNSEKDKPAGKEKIIDASELELLLDALKEAMEETDLDRADAVVEELSEYSYPTDQMELLEKIKMAVLNIDEESLDEVIAQWNMLIK